MKENVEILISMDIDSILKSGKYTMLLLKTYSALFLYGAAPGTCASCMRDYHQKIIKDGKMKAELKEQIDSRICIPAWDGLKYVKAVNKGGKMITIHQHIDSKTLTDAKAIELLNSGALTKDDFKKLPFEEKKAKAKKEDEKN